MIKPLSLAVIVAVSSLTLADGPSIPSSQDRARNPWFVSLGTFAGNSLISSTLNASNTFGDDCGTRQREAEDVLLSSLGMEFGLGYVIATNPVDLRFSSRVQTYGVTNNAFLGRPHSIFGFDALFRYRQVYFGPGIGLGYASGQAQGLQFEGEPREVFSAVLGCDAGERSFFEARLQESPIEAYQAASVSLGFRF